MPGDPMRIYWPIGLTREMPGAQTGRNLFDEALNAYARRPFIGAERRGYESPG